MITFSKHHLKIPALQRPVYLVTAGQSRYDRAIPDKRTEELCIDAFTMASELLGMSPAELKSYIHSCYYGHFADHFGDQLLGEAIIHDRLGLDPLGNVGIRPYGHGRDYVESGDCYHTNPHTGEPGKLPSNLSGGLIGCMHSVGATGIMQTFEIALHIWNRWEELHGDEKIWQRFNRRKPADWTNLEVDNARRGMAVSHAGVGSHVTSSVLMDPDHLIK